MAQWWRISLPMQETQVRFRGREDPLEKEMAPYSSILAWEIPRTEEPGRLQSMGSQKARQDSATYTVVHSPEVGNTCLESQPHKITDEHKIRQKQGCQREAKTKGGR